MFLGCSSLISLDLSIFGTNKNNFDYDNMFDNCNKSLLYWINNETKMYNEYLLSFINSNLNETNNNCSHICFSENAKII